MKLRKKIYTTFILMIVAGTLCFKNMNEAVAHFPSLFGIEPYLIFIGVVYLFLSIGIMEYFVLYRIDHFKEEMSSIRKEGFARHREIFNFSNRDELGEIIQDVNIALYELSEQQQKLETKNKLYMSLVNDESIYAYRFKPNGEITFINNTFASQFNYHYKDLLGKDLYEFFEATGFNAEELKRSIATLNPSRHSSNMIYDMPRVLNEDVPKWIAWTASAAFNEKGMVKEYQVVGINMHKVPGVFKEGDKLENNQSTILLSTDGKIDYMFNSFDCNDAIGEDFLDYVYEPDRWITQRAISRTLADRQKSIVNVRLRLKDKFVYVQMLVDCSIGKDDKIKNIVINAIDMTEIQGAQEKVVGAVSDMHKILEKQNF